MVNNPTCVCGHSKSDHIYEEGACRPGYRCKEGCEEFWTDWELKEQPERLDGLTIGQWRFTAKVQEARANSMEKYSAELIKIIEKLDI